MFSLPAKTPLGLALNTCGLTSAEAQYAIVVSVNFGSIEALSRLEVEDIKDTASSFGKRERNEGKYNLNPSDIANLKALVW